MFLQVHLAYAQDEATARPTPTSSGAATCSTARWPGSWSCPSSSRLPGMSSPRRRERCWSRLTCRASGMAGRLRRPRLRRRLQHEVAARTSSRSSSFRRRGHPCTGAGRPPTGGRRSDKATSDLWWKNAVIYCWDVELFADGDGRRGRRLPRPDRPGRLPGRAGVDLPVADAVLPDPEPGQRLRHRRLLRRRPAAGHLGRRRRVLRTARDAGSG